MAIQARDLYMTPNRDGVTVLHVDRDLATGYCNDVFSVMWRDRTTVEGVAILARSFAEYAKNRVRDTAMLTIIERHARMPSPGSREPLAQYLKDAGSNVLISGVAFEGDGFLAAGIRGVVVGLTMLAKQPYPHRVFRDVAEASRWIEAERMTIGKHFRAENIQSFATRFRTTIARG
jgi:hypothetical protein